MNDEQISIEAHPSPNPQRQRTFTVHFFNDHTIDVTLTSTPSVVRAWLHITLRRLYFIKPNRRVIGLGVQWRPSSDSAATLQLCVGHRCLIFQLQYAPQVPSLLRRFLSDPDNTFVGVWNYSDRDKLRNSNHNLSVANLVDIRDVVEEENGWSKMTSMEELADWILGFEEVKKPTRIGRSDWDDFWLTEEQVQYACVDAFLSFSMGKALHVWNWEG